MNRRPLAVAHRGYSERYPENSRMGFEAAIELGVDYIETDVRLSADGVLACSHDPSLERLSGNPRLISDTNFSVFSHIDIGDAQTLLRLEDVMALAKDRARILIDIKEMRMEIVDAVATSVIGAGMMGQVVFGLRHISQIEHVKQTYPLAECLSLIDNYAEISRAISAGATFIRIWEDDFDDLHIRSHVPEGYPIWVTAGRRRRGELAGYITSERLANLSADGVAAVLLNDPTLLLKLREGSPA